MTTMFKSALFVLLILSISFPTESLGNDINTQFSRSIDFMMSNMIRQDAAPGSVIAAPSRVHPDYFYFWVRDGALVMESAMDLYQSGRLTSLQKQKLQKFFLDHIIFTQTTQQNALKAAGLGEPKFFVDGRVYSGPWGRPQNDGPALRASSLIRLLSIAIRENWPQLEEMKKILYRANLAEPSLIKYDLEYTAKRWHDLNVDLWEEVYGAHFYTLMAQRKALALGSQVAQAFGDPLAAKYYLQEFYRVSQELSRFWDPSRGYIYATLSGRTNISSKSVTVSKNLNKSQLDSAVILAVIHSDIGEGLFTFTDDRILSTFQKVVDSFTALYPINQNNQVGPAIGRYPEDTYDGYQTNSVGNAWVLITAGAAEYLYRTASQLGLAPSIRITQANINFYSKTGGLENLSVGKVVLRGSDEYNKVLQNLMIQADRYLARVMLHANPDGSLSEQINRRTGIQQGAPNLSWSHAGLITAKLARDKALSSSILKGSRGKR